MCITRNTHGPIPYVRDTVYEENVLYIVVNRCRCSNVSGYYLIVSCLPRGYQDHRETWDQRALRESRSAPL